MWYFIDSPQEKGGVYLNYSYEKMVKCFFAKSPSFTEVDDVVFKAYPEDGMTSDILGKNRSPKKWKIWGNSNRFRAL